VNADTHLPRTGAVSPRTISIIAEALSVPFTASEINTLFAKVELTDGTAPRLMSKIELIRRTLLEAREEPGGEQRIKDFLCLAIERCKLFFSDLEPISSALASDGLELQVVNFSKGSPGKTRARVLPVEPSAAPLHTEITALEAELGARGYIEALDRYGAAVKHFAAQDHTSSNAQLRAALESLVVHLAIDHVGYLDDGRANQGAKAIKALRNPTSPGQPKPALVAGQPLPDDDGGLLLQGVWGISHTGGSHPGASDAQESRTRMQLVTATAHLLLRHFPRTS